MDYKEELKKEIRILNWTSDRLMHFSSFGFIIIIGSLFYHEIDECWVPILGLSCITAVSFCMSPEYNSRSGELKKILSNDEKVLKKIRKPGVPLNSSRKLKENRNN